MTILDILFYFFSGLTLFSGLMVVVAKNPVRAALFLVLAFICSSALWLMVQAEFLAMVLVLVYVGAVMVLFLFVVMMLDINLVSLREGFINMFPASFVIGVVLIFDLCYVFNNSMFSINLSSQTRGADFSNIKSLGMHLYTEHLLPFEMAAAVLLVAMIAAVSLTFRGAIHRKSQQPGLQVQVRREDRLRIVKMQPENKG